MTREKLSKLSLVSMLATGVLLLISLVVPRSADAQMGYLRPAPKVAPEPSRAQVAPHSVAIPEGGHVARRVLEMNAIHDPANPDRKYLQSYGEATRNLPHDAVGFPDWMRALREGTINPRTGVNGAESMDVLDLDIIMRNTREMPNVRFPHNSHTMWLACSNCHPAPFIPVAGANQIRMADIFRGQYCGMCHDRVAFVTFFSCDRCHSVPQGSAGKH